MIQIVVVLNLSLLNWLLMLITRIRVKVTLVDMLRSSLMVAYIQRKLTLLMLILVLVRTELLITISIILGKLILAQIIHRRLICSWLIEVLVNQSQASS